MEPSYRGIAEIATVAAGVIVTTYCLISRQRLFILLAVLQRDNLEERIAMEIVTEVDSGALSENHRIPNPNLPEFQRLFAEWGTSADVLRTLRIHITFCRTECRGEYLGCRDSVHHVKLKDLYLLSGVPQHFLEKVTAHELRHVWWALQENPPADLGEENCQKVGKEYMANLLWKFDLPPPTRR